MRWLWLAAVLGCAGWMADRGVEVAAVAEESLTAEEAGDRIWRFKERPAWREPTAREAAAAGGLVRALIAAAPSGQVTAEAAAEAAAVGMAFARWRVGDQELLALLETERRGAGAWIARVGAAPGELMIQAPHPYYDVDTGRIALALWLEGRMPGLFSTSTLQRYTDASGERRRPAPGLDAPADPCHNPAHLLHVGTLAAMEAIPGLRVAQIHGFGGGDGPDDPPPGTAAVVSGGERDAPTPWATAAAAALRPVLGEAVRLYPVDIRLLGATTNVQGLALRRQGDRFLHIELSRAARDRLRDDPGLRAGLAAGLAPPT